MSRMNDLTHVPEERPEKFYLHNTTRNTRYQPDRQNFYRKPLNTFSTSPTPHHISRQSHYYQNEQQQDPRRGSNNWINSNNTHNNEPLNTRPYTNSWTNTLPNRSTFSNQRKNWEGREVRIKTHPAYKTS